HPLDAHVVAVALLGNFLLKRPLQLDESTQVMLENDTVFCVRINKLKSMNEQFCNYPVIVSALDESTFASNAREAIQMVLQCESLWAIKSNLLEAFGIESYVHLK
ncbi:MAG: hypothetical protein JNL09_04135, partial [Anaerolineales bacterium]|nr:hypothetical protein [Anaerolineales bacterium]